MSAHHTAPEVSGLKGVLLPVVTSPTHTKAVEPIVRAGRRGRSWRLPALGSVLVAAAVCVLSAGTAAAAEGGDTCANAVVRAENSSTGLPGCRAYEMVSSPYKEGFMADEVTLRFTGDGVVSYGSVGTFAGNQLPSVFNRYHATRSAAGWVPSSVSLPGWIYYARTNTAEAESADLGSSLWFVLDRLDMPGDNPGYYLRGPDGTVTRIGDAINAGGEIGVAGASADLSHVVYTQVTSPLFEHVGTGNGPQRTVSVDNNGLVQGPACFRRISPDGRVIVYSTECAGGTPTGTPQVWARIGGAVSVLASGSKCTRGSGDLGGACNGVTAATYAGGAKDGSRVFFTTRQQLVNGDTDTGDGSDPDNPFAGNDLYACDVPAGVPAPVGSANPCAALTEVSGAAADGRVENVVSVSDDGSRVYFVAQGVLADNLGVREAGAVDGGHNLYMWQRDGSNPAGTVRFVTGLDSCPAAPSCNDLTRAQMTPDGRYLLFLTANTLVTSGPGADDDSQVDAYRYDAVTKSVVRVSTSVAGSGGNSGFDVSMVAAASSISADGSTVIFDTAEALSAADTDGVADVYSWRADGGVSLISAGGAVSVGITPSGRDIFFITAVQVLGADRDFLRDVYDARAGGGFAAAQAPPPCSGAGCQGQRSQPPSLVGPSPTGSGTGGLGAVEVSPAFSLRAVSAAQRKALAATGKISLTVTSNAAGTISAKATAAIGGKTMTAGSGRRVLAAPGRAVLSLVLSKRARSQLVARGKLSVRVSVSHSKVALDRSVTLRLVHAKAMAKGSAQRTHARPPAAGAGGGRS